MKPTTVGEQLAQARAAKGLSLDEASHETRIRPDKLTALEQDDFSAFPSNTYARGFLLIYGKFLGVPVQDLAGQLESSNPISVQDYQYLNATPELPPEQRVRVRPREKRSRRPSIAPLIVFILLALASGFGLHFYISAQRLGNLGELKSVNAIDESGDESSAAGDPPRSPSSADALLPEPVGAQPAPVSPEDREFVQPKNSATPSPATPEPVAPPRTGGLNELSIDPIKKTWVRVRRDDPASEPIFEDYLYPNVGPLKLKGLKFYLEVRDDGAVQLQKNGQPLAYQPPGMVVQ